MTNGGVKRMLSTQHVSFLLAFSRSKSKAYMFTWVGLANTLRLLSSKQNCHAVRPRELALSSMTMALNNPRPRTSLTSGERSERMPLRNCSPSRSARSARFSSISTSSAVIATAQASGFLFMFVYARETRKVKVGREVAPAVGTSMLARSYTEHDVLIRQYSGYRIHAPGESFSKKNYVRTNAFVLYAQHFARPTEALIESILNTIIIWKVGRHCLTVCISSQMSNTLCCVHNSRT